MGVEQKTQRCLSVFAIDAAVLLVSEITVPLLIAARPEKAVVTISSQSERREREAAIS